MITDQTMISVRNRNNGFTGYSIPDKGIWRNFSPNETKRISFEELRQLQYQPGGDYTLENLLVVEDAEALKMLNMQVEPEYNYSNTDIRRILFEGTIDELKDFLDFAPEGAIEIAKEIAVKEEIPDVRKRDVISKATGFNVTNAINVNHVMEDPDEVKEPVKKERRVTTSKAAEETTTAKQRRVPTPSYKVVDKK